MAGAGGTAPKKQPSIDDLREMLIPELIKHLSGPEPTPPQYQPAPISPMQGFAMARNPQAAGLINQQIQGPAQAQYAQQQAAFEAAMQGRQQAMQGAIGLAKETSPLDVARLQETMRHNQAMENKPENMAFLQTPQGIYPTGRRTGQVGEALKSPSGATLYPPPPAGVVQGVAATTATLSGLDDVYKAYQDIRDKTAGQGSWLDIARQRAGTAVGESRLGGALAPEYAKYTAARRASLNAYIKGQTGAQFSVKELDRYDTQYPEPWDPDDVAVEKINALRERAISDMQAKLRAFPGAAGAASQTRGQYSGVTLHESDFANAKPGERERFIAGGGKVVP